VRELGGARPREGGRRSDGEILRVGFGREGRISGGMAFETSDQGWRVGWAWRLMPRIAEVDGSIRGCVVRSR
jgi:hypothetical protein